MRTLLPLFLLATAALTVFGQTTGKTVTADVSMLRTGAAGTALIQIQVLDATLNANVDGAIAIGAPGGASAANLAGVSVSLNQGFVITQYTFNVRVPVGEFGGARDRLITAQRALANSNTQALSWSVEYEATEDELANALKQALPALTEKAKAKATALAEAMGLALGELTSLSSPAVTSSGLQLVVSLSAKYAVQ